MNKAGTCGRYSHLQMYYLDPQKPVWLKNSDPQVIQPTGFPRINLFWPTGDPDSCSALFPPAPLLQAWSRMLRNIRLSVPSSSSMLFRTIWNYMSATDSSQTSRTLQCEPVSWLRSLWGRVLTLPAKSGTSSFTSTSFTLFHPQELANTMPTPLSWTTNEYIRLCDVIWQFKKPEWLVILNSLLRMIKR